MSWNTGSVIAEIGKIIPDIPSTLSGTEMTGVIDQQRYFISQYTGDAVGDTDIASKYQQPLLHLTAAALLTSMELQGVDVSSVKLGDFTETKGKGSISTQSKDYFYQIGMQGLRLLGREIGYYKSNG